MDVAQREEMPKPMRLSTELGDLVGHGYYTRTKVVKELWNHIKTNQLQDPSDKRYILCDDKLYKIFQAKRLFMYTMNQLLDDHLFKLTPEENIEATALFNLKLVHITNADSAKEFSTVSPGSADPGNTASPAINAPHSADSSNGDADDADDDNSDDGNAHSNKSVANRF